MATTLTYRMTKTDAGYLATCVEHEAEATGGSPEEAIAALRKAAEEQLASVEAIAPPARSPSVHVALVPAVEPHDEPQGPGDSPAAD